MSRSRQAVGILGGSFDPVHNGHVAIARSFINSDYISELWILLTPDPPHKSEKPLSDYHDRFRMLQAAFESIEDVTVSDLEDQLPRPSYTVRTLQYLTDKYPQIDFMLCLGEDSARDFKAWKDWRQLIGYANLLVARRPSEKSFNIEPELAGNIFFADHQPVDISSTEVRKKVAVGEDISALVPKEVSRIIKEENLYKAN